MADEIVRKANSSDIESLCRLYFEFHEFHVRGVPERLRTQGSFAEFDNSELSTNLQMIIDDEKAMLLIAEVVGQKVGFAEVHLRQDEPNPLRMVYRYGHLQSLMVLEDYRGQGIGTLLVEAAEEWARERGAREMRLDTWEFMGDPVVFYEKIGYRTMRRTMVHVL